jgi:hypothetical protein
MMPMSVIIAKNIFVGTAPALCVKDMGHKEASFPCPMQSWKRSGALATTLLSSDGKTVIAQEFTRLIICDRSVHAAFAKDDKLNDLTVAHQSVRAIRFSSPPLFQRKRYLAVFSLTVELLSRKFLLFRWFDCALTPLLTSSLYR